jgi:hypothetical protein
VLFGQHKITDIDEETFITNVTIKSEAFSGYEPRTSWLKIVETEEEKQNKLNTAKTERNHNTPSTYLHPIQVRSKKSFPGAEIHVHKGKGHRNYSRENIDQTFCNHIATSNAYAQNETHSAQQTELPSLTNMFKKNERCYS